MCNRLKVMSYIIKRYHSMKSTSHQQAMMARGLPKRTPIEGVQHIIAVGSGKGICNLFDLLNKLTKYAIISAHNEAWICITKNGYMLTELFKSFSSSGVGKSSVSVNLALALSRLNHQVGILDADIFGPSLPTLLNLRNHKAITTTKTKLIEPLINFNLKCMSISFLTRSDSAIVWRGLMVMQAIEKLVRQVAWSPLDYLIIDLPPGTGDIQLSLAQLVPLSGVIMVTTPQELALVDVRKAIEMFRLLNTPILGIVENFSTYFCKQCGHEERIFGENGGQTLANEFHLNVLQSLPIDTHFRQACDQGRPIVNENETILCSKFNNLGKQIIELMHKNKITTT